MQHASAHADNVRFYDLHPSRGDTRSEILAGLRQPQKTVNPKWFYDQLGSQLFAEITRLPEYYPTRTETALLTTHAQEISQHCGADCVFIEPGSGNSEKVRLLLDALKPSSYVPVDISAEFLHGAARTLGSEYSWLAIDAICADFGDIAAIESLLPTGRRVVFYPGSTIGNLEPTEAEDFLANIRAMVGNSGGALIGVDLHKDRSRLEAAYNDSAGITARFNLNILTHLNRLVDGDFDEMAFTHSAFYNDSLRRIEMHLVSNTEQSVRCDSEQFQFLEGESLHTENSYKYSIESFYALAEGAGFSIARSWTDNNGLFSLHFLEVPA